MKKIFAIALAVVMVLSIASVASAFTWTKPADSVTADNFGYSIDVIKFTRSTGALGSSSFNADEAATAVNGADVYWAIKLVVNGPSASVKKYAKVDVTCTAIGNQNNWKRIDISNKDNGVYYYYWDATNQLAFYTIDELSKLGVLTNGVPVWTSRCLDTETAKVTAKVYTERPFGAGNWFQAGDYSVEVTDTTVTFSKTPGEYVRFVRNSDGLVTSVDTNLTNPQDLITLYAWLNNGDADSIKAAIANKEMYMTNDNLHAAFGFSYSQSDSATWKANSTPIILDHTVSIPKTGDNASVIGFAMIMVAVVAAAVAVRKVNA